MTPLLIVWYVGILIVWWVAWFFSHKFTLKEKTRKFNETMENAKSIEENIIQQAKKKWEDILHVSTQRAEQLEKQKQLDIDKRVQKIEQMEARLLQREEKMDAKLDELTEEKQKVFEKQKEADLFIDKKKKELEAIAWLTELEAKDALFAQVEEIYTQDKLQFINKLKTIKKEEADEEAAKIIAQALPRVASTNISEYTVVSVDIPSEDFKWRLIGREWRNIMYFEKITWCELIIDDTPLLVRVSSFDHEKRFLAVEALKKMIKDAKINPYYIEKMYGEMVSSLDEILSNKWKEALNMLNLPMMKPEIVRMIWQFYLRFSYGQNLWSHSIEVAKICEAIASELGLDSTLAKKAWLLHDIWKIVAQTWESHAIVGADILRKFGADPVVINAAESHHHDVPMTHPISWVVTAADGMSWARPWARFNTNDLFIQKMWELEKLMTNVTWVQKVHIMQAWREIMVYADPQNVSDLELEWLLKTIWEKMEEQLDYPWIIRVVGIRETKLIEFLK